MRIKSLLSPVAASDKGSKHGPQAMLRGGVPHHWKSRATGLQASPDIYNPEYNPVCKQMRAPGGTSSIW